MEENGSDRRVDDVHSVGGAGGADTGEGSREGVCGGEDDEYETMYFVVQFPELEGTGLLERTQSIKLSVRSLAAHCPVWSHGLSHARS